MSESLANVEAAMARETTALATDASRDRAKLAAFDTKFTALMAELDAIAAETDQQTREVAPPAGAPAKMPKEGALGRACKAAGDWTTQAISTAARHSPTGRQKMKKDAVRFAAEVRLASAAAEKARKAGTIPDENFGVIAEESEPGEDSDHDDGKPKM